MVAEAFGGAKNLQPTQPADVIPALFPEPSSATRVQTDAELSAAMGVFR